MGLASIKNVYRIVQKYPFVTGIASFPAVPGSDEFIKSIPAQSILSSLFQHALDIWINVPLRPSSLKPHLA